MVNHKFYKDLLLYFGIAAVFVVSDSLIKDRVEAGKFKERLILKDNIRLKYLKNYGAAGSMLKSRPELVKALSVVMTAIGTVELSILCDSERKTLQKIGLSVLMAGGVSNTIDRVIKGYVTDYFSFDKANSKLKKLVFNISDFEILAGSLLYSVGRCIEE